MTSAKIAMPSSVRTMKAPKMPSGFSLSRRTQSSRNWERVRVLVVGRVNLPSTALALDIITAFLTYALLPIADAGIKVCVAEVHHEIQQEREGGHNQIDALHHWEVPTNQRLKEETPHTRQPEDGLDDHSPARIEGDLQAEEA